MRKFILFFSILAVLCRPGISQEENTAWLWAKEAMRVTMKTSLVVLPLVAASFELDRMEDKDTRSYMDVNILQYTTLCLTLVDQIVDQKKLRKWQRTLQDVQKKVNAVAHVNLSDVLQDIRGCCKCHTSLKRQCVQGNIHKEAHKGRAILKITTSVGALAVGIIAFWSMLEEESWHYPAEIYTNFAISTLKGIEWAYDAMVYSHTNLKKVQKSFLKKVQERREGHYMA